MSNYNVLPASLAIRSMKSSGFKSTDYAVAELIDNSIQAGEKNLNTKTNIDVVCVERKIKINNKKYNAIKEILIFDDAGGMDPDTLRNSLRFGQGTNLDPEEQKGMGKFGMGLPNSSISQCDLVEVYSWQNKGEVFFTKLDLEAIYQGSEEIPGAVKKDIPKKYHNASNLCQADGGTLIIWKKLDKPSWVRHEAFFKNSEFLVGRMYRHYISSGKAEINFKAFFEDGIGNFEKKHELKIRPNDPLMLMHGTSAPDGYNDNPAFEETDRPHPFPVSINGKTSIVNMRFSIAKKSTRETTDQNVSAGATPIGKYCARNIGVSIVRAGRELELNTTWISPDTRERWWSIEISFEPELDDIFGVTNDKQHARNLYQADLSNDAENLDLKKYDYLDSLRESEDPRYWNYEISRIINARISTMRKTISDQQSSKKNGPSKKRKSEKIATLAINERSQKGYVTSTDKDNIRTSIEDKTNRISDIYHENGMMEEDAIKLANMMTSNNLRFHYIDASLNSGSIFDFSQECGDYVVKINRNHPVYKNIFKILDDNEDEDSAGLIGLKMLISAWVRLEDEAMEGSKDKEFYEDTRIAWGQMTRDFMRGLND